MADENKIQLDIEISESSVDKSFGAIDKRAEKSAKESASVFGEYFQKQEQGLQDSIARLTASTKTLARKSAEESARVFAETFSKQDAIYKASVKQNMDNAIAAITGSDRLKKSAQDSAKVFEEALGPVSQAPTLALTELAAGWFLVKEAASVAGSAIKGAIDFIVEGEQKVRLENRFKAMAENAGIAADVLKNNLNSAVKGLVDDDQLLRLAAESFIQIGTNAKQLPEILELASKTYKVFGGDIVSNAERIQTAIVTGNKRALREIGLYTDLENAVKAYARQLGTVPALLSEAQLQEARLNAILAEGSKRFQSAQTDQDGVTESIARLKVQVSQTSDALKIMASDLLGFTAKDAIDATTESLEALSKTTNENVPKSVEEITAKIVDLKTEIGRIKAEVGNAGYWEKLLTGMTWTDAAIEEKTKLIEGYRAQLAQLQSQQKATAESAAKTPVVAPQDAAVSEEFLRRRQELVNKVRDLNNQVNQSELALAQDRFNREQTTGNLEQLAYQQRLAANQQFLQSKAQLEKFFVDNGVNDETLRNQARQAMEEAHFNRLLQLRENYERAKQNSIETANQAEFSSLEFLGDTFTYAWDSMSKQTKISLSEITKSVLMASAKIGSEIATRWGAQLVKGREAWALFGESIKNIIGDMLISIGNTMIVQGLAIDALKTSLLTLNGGAAVAAGLALIAVGGALKASAEQGAQGSVGGVGSGIETPTPEPVAPEDLQSQGPQTQINVNISGNVLDRRETGLEIAQILEEQFSNQGLTIRGA